MNPIADICKPAMPEDLGVVVIGRNEGERLARCLRSLEGCAVVYVDSGSTDRSIEVAQDCGAIVVRLDTKEPFTAARARNAGFRRLLEWRPSTRFVQFVDGDCEVVSGWLQRAYNGLAHDERVAVVCGRRREIFRDASIYNRLCDIEWNAPVGVVASCGGDAMMRATALGEVGGYRDSMIAGEEPELCIRLRQKQWEIHRIAADMTRHDAAIGHFSQWWRRSTRAGHAFAETAWLHGSTEKHVVRRIASVTVWALVVPLVSLVLCIPTRGVSLLCLPLVYGFLGWRVFRSQRGRYSAGDRALYAAFVIIGKFAELCGMLRFAAGVISRRRARIIEYKEAHLPSAEPNTP